MKLYLAGPLFTTAEIAFNTIIAEQLRMYGHDCFLPQEMEQMDMNAERIFLGDKKGIDWCECVVACLDGADPDSGTCWELGYAFGLRKKAIGYRTDFRIDAGVDKVNLMMSVSVDKMLYLPFSPPLLVAEALDVAVRDLTGDVPLNGDRYRHCDK